MSIEIKVPPLGESVTSATVARWLKKAGEAVAADEPLVELETDKVTVEVNAPEAGQLESVDAQEGAEVGVGARLGAIAAGDGGSRPAAPDPITAATPRRRACPGRPARSGRPPRRPGACRPAGARPRPAPRRRQADART